MYAILSASVFVAFAVVLGGALEPLQLARCGKSVGCWAFPNGCTGDDCQGIVQWRVNKKGLHVIGIQGKIIPAPEGNYVSLAFSNDDKMGEDTVLDCITGGTNKVLVSVNKGSSNVLLPETSKKAIAHEKFLQKDGQITCSFTYENDAHSNDEADASTLLSIKEPRHLLFATGAADSKTGAKSMHEGDKSSPFYPWASGEPVDLASLNVVTKSHQ